MVSHHNMVSPQNGETRGGKEYRKICATMKPKISQNNQNKHITTSDKEYRKQCAKWYIK